MKVYDKVSWHFPDGTGCPSLEAATKHFKKLIDWLRSNQLLSVYGLEFAKEDNIGSEFSINERMLTDEGKRLLDQCYDSWIGMIDYGDEVSLSIFDDAIKQSGNGGMSCPQSS